MVYKDKVCIDKMLFLVPRVDTRKSLLLVSISNNMECSLVYRKETKKRRKKKYWIIESCSLFRRTALKTC